MSTDITEYMEELSEQVLQHLPDADEPTVENRLVGIHVNRANKRNITIYVQTRGSNVLEIRYGMPVPGGTRTPTFEPGSTHLVFADHTIRRGYNHIQSLRVADPLWDSELDRLIQSQFDHPEDSPARKRIADVIRYWRFMKRKIMRALANGGVDTQGSHTFQRASRSSSNRSTRRRSSRGTTPPSSNRTRSRRRNRV